MEVTSSNFQEVLVELDEILKNATFLCIDGEFTGLNSGPDGGVFDTPAQYYAKLRTGSMDFLLIQFGLSVFTFNKEMQKYNQRSYNFYVFPRPLNRMAPDCRFMCQTSSISFLASQGFDFNKLFKLGIPYLTTNEEEKLMKRLEEKQRIRDEGTEILPISDVERPQIEEICSRIDEFVTSETEELLIEKCNAFIRRLVYQEVKLRWPNKLKVESKMNNFGCILVVQRLGTKEEEEQREIEKREREKTEIQQAVGLSILMRKIADSGKLIVGHNMLLDLCHIVHQFFGQLPESYFEFKSLVHSLFPRILDTKIICHSQQFKENIPSSNLGILLETVSKSPFKITEVEPIDGRSYSTLSEKCHEAGYDAYITGICFIALSNYLGSLQKPEVPIVLSDSPLLNPFLNKLLIARLKDVPYINLVGDDPNPSRDHVFHLTFPKEWKFNDISHLFSPFGSVHVSWLSDISAYIELHRRDQVNEVMKVLAKTSTYKLQTYADYQASLENFNTGERKRKLSSSEAVSTLKKGEKSVATNGVKNPQDDDSWEVATGNDLELSSDSIIPCPYPHERSRATSGPRGGGNHEADEASLILEQMKVVQRIRLKNSLSLPTDLRNDRRKDAVPKYTILKRNPQLYRDDVAMTVAVNTGVDEVAERKVVSKSIESLSTSSNLCQGSDAKPDDRCNPFVSGSGNNSCFKQEKSSRKGRVSDKATVCATPAHNSGGAGCGRPPGGGIQARTPLVPAKCSNSNVNRDGQECHAEATDALRKRVGGGAGNPAPSTSTELSCRGKRQPRTKFCGSRNNLNNKERGCPDDERQNCSQRWPRRSNDDRIERRFSKGRRLFIILVKVLGIIFLYYIVIKTD